jgi:hypothetical protein
MAEAQALTEKKRTVRQAKESGLLRVKEGDKVDKIIRDLQYKDPEGLVDVSKKNLIDLKALAIVYCIAFTREYIDKKTKEVRMAPNFRHVGRLIGKDHHTVERWWNNKDKIKIEQSAFIRSSLSMVQLETAIALIRVINEINNRDLQSVKNKDLIFMFNSLAMQSRLMDGLSTQNVAHVHRGAVQLVGPEGSDI